MSQPAHIPVLHTIIEANTDSSGDHPGVMRVLAPVPGETVLDVTLGLAGHASGFLEHILPGGHLYGLDADGENLALARKRLQPWMDSVTLIHANFAELASLDLPALDIIFADLGVSSPHFDDPERGFTFRHDAPLDLRYDRTRGRTAAELLSESDEAAIVRILRQYGELKDAKRLGATVYGAARHGKLKTTTDLRLLCEALYGHRAITYLPQIFQALRIAVNEELAVLETLLSVAPSLLKPGGRFGVLTYHSLEDRLVKHVFRTLSTPVSDPLTGAVSVEAPYELLLKKAVMPSSEEITQNPRARSAKFRALRRRMT